MHKDFTSQLVARGISVTISRAASRSLCVAYCLATVRCDDYTLAKKADARLFGVFSLPSVQLGAVTWHSTTHTHTSKFKQNSTSMCSKLLPFFSWAFFDFGSTGGTHKHARLVGHCRFEPSGSTGDELQCTGVMSSWTKPHAHTLKGTETRNT